MDNNTSASDIFANIGPEAGKAAILAAAGATATFGITLLLNAALVKAKKIHAQNVAAKNNQ